MQGSAVKFYSLRQIEESIVAISAIAREKRWNGASECFEVARFDVFRANGPTIYLAQANGLGDRQTRH